MTTHNKQKKTPIWAWSLYGIGTVAVIVFLILLWMRMGAQIGILFGIAGSMIYAPLLMRYAATKLNKIRLDVIKAVRANEKPTVPVAKVLALFAVLTMPALVLAAVAVALPWRSAGGIFYIPCVFLLVVLALWHGSIWMDIGWKRIFLFMYLTALLLLSTVLGFAVGAMF